MPTGAPWTKVANWAPSTNTPTLPNVPSLTAGQYYECSDSGVFLGIEYTTGDYIYADGGSYQKLDNTSPLSLFVKQQQTVNVASYRTISHVSGSHTAGRVAGTYGLGQGHPLAISGTGILYPLNLIHIVQADIPTINGLPTKLRIRAQLYTNDVAPSGNYTFGLYPVTRPATSGGAGLCIYTLGSVVNGSNGASFTNPAADLMGNAVSADFSLPADGVYCIGVVTTATVAANAHMHMVAQLQMRNA